MITQIQERLEKVIETFKSGQKIAQNKWSLEESIQKIQGELNHTFISVAYEGLAAGLTRNGERKSLFNLLDHEIAKFHKGQIFVGIGWGLAENRQTDFEEFADNDFEKWKLLDGFGYFHGLLRKRRFIKAQAIPENLETDELLGFDQGLGRSLWYHTKSNLEKLTFELSHFDKKRLPAVWRGIGLAAFYVGGLNNECLLELFVLSGDYQTSFLLGAAVAILGRKHAQTLEKESLEAFTDVVNKPAEEMLNDMEYPFGKEWSVSQWIEKNENLIAGKFKKR